METWNYPPTKPEVHNRIAIKEGPNQVLDKQVDKQTDRQTDTLITILRTPTRGEMIRYTPSVAWSYAPITDESRTAADGRLFVVLTTRHVADVLVLDTKCRTLYLDITMCRPNGTLPYWPAVKCRQPDRLRARPPSRRLSTCPAASRPARQQCYWRRQTTMTDDKRQTTTNDSQQSNTGQLGGQVINWRT